MKLKLSLLFLLSCNFMFAEEINNYMNEYKSTGKSDYKAENYIIEKYALPKLIDELSPFFSDSIIAVRRKAYHFIYKKGLISKARQQQKAVLKLLDGCKDKNGGVVGQSLSYLQEFPQESFKQNSKDEIDNLLKKKQIFHFKKLALLAGFVGTGQETMHKKLLLPDISNENKWILSLALARQGSSEHASYCVETVKNLSINNDFVSYIIPDLIYTRHRQTINYCVEIINSDSKDCYSPNPDKPEFILCGYRIMELLAPVIIDFPFQTDATGSLVTNDYEKALNTIRTWLKNNPTYQVRP